MMRSCRREYQQAASRRAKEDTICPAGSQPRTTWRRQSMPLKREECPQGLRIGFSSWPLAQWREAHLVNACALGRRPVSTGRLSRCDPVAMVDLKLLVWFPFLTLFVGLSCFSTLFYSEVPWLACEKRALASGGCSHPASGRSL